MKGNYKIVKIKVTANKQKRERDIKKKQKNARGNWERGSRQFSFSKSLTRLNARGPTSLAHVKCYVSIIHWVDSTTPIQA